MGGSNQSSVSESLSTKGGALASSREESGWTEYLEGFMASEERGATSGSSSCAVSADGGGSSLLSDAASCVLPWKAPPTCNTSEGSKGCKKLKRRTRLQGDDELEDTASSPVSSPKVNDLSMFDMNNRKKDDMRDISQGKELATVDLSETRGYGSVNEMDYGESTNNSIKLKKKGLCLVPMSMLVDYLG